MIISRMKFIKNWATTRCRDEGKTNIFQNGSDSDEDLENEGKQMRILSKRRNAVFLHAEDDQDRKQRQNVKKSDKLQEVKSRMMINLANMPILAPLNPQEIWQLVEKSQIKSYYDNAVVLSKLQPIKLLFIIITGGVIRNREYGKPMQYFEGQCFGEQSLIFQRESEDEYRSIGNTKIATIWGLQISQMVQKANRRRYELILKGITTCQYLHHLFPDQMQKVANILMNQKPIPTLQEDDSLNQSQYKKSLFMVVQGEFGEYNRRLDDKKRGDALRIYQSGQCFGIDVLVAREKETLMMSHIVGSVLELRLSDLQKTIGPVYKIVRRKQH